MQQQALALSPDAHDLAPKLDFEGPGLDGGERRPAARLPQQVRPEWDDVDAVAVDEAQPLRVEDQAEMVGEHKQLLAQI